MTTQAGGGSGVRMEDQELTEVQKIARELRAWENKRQKLCRRLAEAAYEHCMKLLMGRVRIDKLTGEETVAPPDARICMSAAALMREFDRLSRIASIDVRLDDKTAIDHLGWSSGIFPTAGS